MSMKISKFTESKEIEKESKTLIGLDDMIFKKEVPQKVIELFTVVHSVHYIIVLQSSKARVNFPHKYINKIPSKKELQ